MSQKSKESRTHRLIRNVLPILSQRLPALIKHSLSYKPEGWRASDQLRSGRNDLGWNESSAATIVRQIEDIQRRSVKLRSKEEIKYSPSDLRLAGQIAEATSRAGISNLTRTKAYLDIYHSCPELHWAFLAHMVSRNAGYNMTDLRGSRSSEVMEEENLRWCYRFLERSNALIFQDAYPQLLLYLKSREIGKSQFHLLPYFHVSNFMRPFWERFWIDRNSALLTVGLIINEQNYIEKRVVQNPNYQKHVTHKGNFRLYSISGLNQVVFPLMDGKGETRDSERMSGTEGGVDGRASDERMGKAEGIRLAGRTVSDFSSLNARIALGKSLYAMLMALPAVRSGAEHFAARVPHTGSRADYWPELFTANREEALTLAAQGTELLKHQTLPAGQRLYSPKLTDAWGDTPYEPISREDWLTDQSALGAISAPKPPFLCDISRRHRNGILKTALAHDAAVSP